MENDLDEDVLFKNSELYRYLQDTGFEFQESDCIDREKKIENTKKKTCNFCSFVRRSLRSLFWPLIVIKEKVCQLRYNYQRHNIDYTHYLKKICSNEILTEDDLLFLENYSLSKVEVSPHRISHTFLYWVLTPILPAYSIAKWMGFEISRISKQTELIFIVLVTFIWLSETWVQLKVLQEKRQHKTNLYLLVNLLSECTNLNATIRKAIRLIQELEVVARGFTLALPATPISKLEMSSFSPETAKRQCPALRATLFYCTREVIQEMRSATLSLIQSYKLSCGVDNSSHYVAAISTEEFGPLMTVSKHKNDDLLKETDNFSLSSIKSMYQLYNIQQSEYLRRIALSFCVELYDEPVYLENLFWNFPAVVATTLNCVATNLQSINHSFNFHKLMSQNNLKRPSTLEVASINRQPSPIQPIHTAMHSLSLHLQAALTRSINVESYLEKMDEKLKDKNLDVSLLDETDLQFILNQLLSVKLELDACRVCHEEGIKRFDLHSNSKDNQEVVKIVASADTISEQHKQVAPINLFEMGDPIIEDQVFEGYVDEEIHQANDYNSSDDIYFDKDKLNREHEASKHLFKELKSILTVKADEWKHREAQALARMKGDARNIPFDLNDINENTEQSTSQATDEDKTKDLKEGKLVSLSSDDASITNSSVTEVPDKSSSEYSPLKKIKTAEHDYGVNGVSSAERVESDSYETGVSRECSDSEDSSSSSKNIRTVNLNEDNTALSSLSREDHDEVKERLQRFTSIDLNVSASVAALAVARAKQFSQPTGFTFCGAGEEEQFLENSDDEASD